MGLCPRADSPDGRGLPIDGLTSNQPSQCAAGGEGMRMADHSRGQISTSRAARNLVQRRSQIMGMIIPEALPKVFSDPYFPAVLQGILDALMEKNYYPRRACGADH